MFLLSERHVQCDADSFFELVKAEFCRFCIGSQYLYADFFKTGTIFCKQFNFRINQRCDRIDFFLAANVKDPIKIGGIINARNKVICICHIQSRCQIG